MISKIEAISLPPGTMGKEKGGKVAHGARPGVPVFAWPLNLQDTWMAGAAPHPSLSEEEIEAPGAWIQTPQE